jgi:hypothetical protein
MSDFSYSIDDRRVVLKMADLPCKTPDDVLNSELFVEIVQRFIEKLDDQRSPLLGMVGMASLKRKGKQVSEAADLMAKVFRMLLSHRAEGVGEQAPELTPLFASKARLVEFMDKLYDFWRDFERFLIYETAADDSRDRSVEGHQAFVAATEDLRSLVLRAFRRVSSNLQGHWPRVYRNVPAGVNMGLLVDKIDWTCPGGAYSFLKEVPFVRLASMQLPVVFYPRRNYRKGQFKPVTENPLEGVSFDPSEWYCMPLMVGPLLILTFFHQEYLGLGSSLINLFELAGHNDARKQPDGILVFGVEPGQIGEGETVFYEDDAQNLVVGAIARCEDVDYFGYFKKMILTLHNVIMIRRGKLPIHGAMCRIELKDGSAANVVIVGDSGAGKSESLEAFRVLAKDQLRSMTIVFDDMGSLGLRPDGKVAGYGTETGAFVRLDDLQPGYAFGQIDRSIFMSPHKTNARLVIPVTTYSAVMAGYNVDLFLYANNYEQLDEDHPYLQFYATPDEALHVFREGYRAAKGTTDEKGLVHTYFANPFGPSQLKERHDPLAKHYLAELFRAGVKVGQLRTRLGIPGYEQEGPESAAQALFEVLRGARG